MVECLLFYRGWSWSRSWSRSWPGADEKILVSGAGQKWTSSATLNQTSVATMVSDPHSSNPGPDPTGVYY